MKILSIRVAVEEVMRVGLEIRGYILLHNISLMNSLVDWRDCELRILILITHEIRKLMVDKMLSTELLKSATNT